MTDSISVLAAGVGVRRGSRWTLRSVSFRMSVRRPGRLVLGVATSQAAAATAMVDLLAGLAKPSHGELRVLGKDLTTAEGREAVRPLVGVARRTGRSESRFRVRDLVFRAARGARVPGRDRAVLTAGILDRLGLTPWAEVRLSAAPPVVSRRARLAAAAVHEPELLLLDGLLDDLSARERAGLVESVRELAKDTVILVAGCDATALRLACDEVMTLSDGILAGA